MRMYLIALAVGVFVGGIYGLLGVRSPAPPVAALIGLFGILIGEQMAPVGVNLFHGASFRSALGDALCVHHIFGTLPGRHSPPATAAVPAHREKQS